MPELAHLHMLVVNMMFSTVLIPSLSPSQSFRKVQLHIPALAKRDERILKGKSLAYAKVNISVVPFC